MADLRTYRKLDRVRLIGDLVRSWWKLEVAFADESGYVLDHADGRIVPSGNELCRLSLFSKDGFKRCNDSVKLVSDRLRTGKERSVFVHACHLGFDIVAAPIYFDGELAGFFFTGGAYHEEPKASERVELVQKVRELSAADTAEVEAAVPKVPRMSPVELEHLSSLIELGAEAVMNDYEAKRAKVTAARVESREEHARFGDIVGSSQAMADVFDLLGKIVRAESTVLVHGESGTGKELIARAIHYHGPRAKKPFVVQNCSAFNDNLLETALFGHVRGAFTGAVKDQKGLFEVADGGTFFLDEIGDMSPALQVKLLRVLQEGTFTPVGATKPVSVDVRIIAASHKDLTAMVGRGEFREDLYYRVNVLKITVPPLRDRIEDLEMLTSHFLTKHHRGGDDGQAPRLAPATLEAMRAYRWPGNIRELENEIERLSVLTVGEDEIGPDLLSPRVRDAAGVAAAATPPSRAPLDQGKVGTLRDLVERVEAEAIVQGLIRTHWNKSQLAKELGISRSNLIQKCSYYGLDRKE